MIDPTPDLRARVEKIVYGKHMNPSHDYWEYPAPFFDAILDLIREEKEAMIERLRRADIPHVDSDKILNKKEVLEAKIFGAAMATKDFNLRLDEEQARL